MNLFSSLLEPKVIHGLTLFAVTGLCIFAFNNCAEMSPLASAVSEQASVEFRLKNDQSILQRLFPSSSLKVWFNVPEAEGKTGCLTASGSTISKICSLRDGGLTVESPTGGVGPTITNSNLLGSPVILFGNGKSLQTSNLDNFGSSVYTILAVVENPSVGQVASISLADNSENMHLKITSDSKVVATHETSAGNSSSKTMDLPRTSHVVIAAAWGDQPDDISLQVQGNEVKTAVTQQGTPTGNTFGLRRITLGDPAANSGDLKVVELLAFTYRLKACELNVFSRYLTKKWKIADAYYDTALEGCVPTTVEEDPDEKNPLFQEVKTIVAQKKCASCHSYQHSFKPLSAKSFRGGSSPSVVAGQPDLSALLVRTAGPGPSMPPGGGSADYPAFTDSDREVIRNWINSLK